MATELDIIDTAVKIGLGAIISSVATYIVAHKNHQNEISTSLVNDKKSLLIEITRKVDKSNELKNNTVHAIWLKRKSGVENISIKEELAILWAAGNELKNAISNAYLIGQTDLSKPLKELHNSLNELHGHFAEHEILYDYGFVEANTKNRVGLHNALHEIYAKALESIHT